MTNQQTEKTNKQQTLPPRYTFSQLQLINLESLGYFLDGWADLIEGMGSKADQIRTDVIQNLTNRDMPEITITPRKGYIGLTSLEKRDYGVAETPPGATTTIYIAQHGKDLYVSWRSFIRPVLNQQTLLIMLGFCIFLGLLTGGIQEDFFGRETSFSFAGWIAWTIGFLILATVGLLFAGR